MGTYQFKPFTLFNRDNGPKNWGTFAVNPASDAQLVTAVNNAFGTNYFVWSDDVGTLGSASLTFLGRWYLDGSATPLEIQDLPTGFLVTSCQFQITGGSQWTSSDYDYLISYATELDVPIPSTPNVLFTHTPAAVPSALAIDTFIKFHLTKNSNSGNPTYHKLLISGDYEIVAGSYTMEPASGANVNANTSADENDGDLITITSDPNDPDHLLLNELVISVTCGDVIIITQTELLIESYIPVECSGSGVTTITATGNGVQFSGSIILGTLTILLTNGSGLYVLSPGALHDTLYSSLRDGTTKSVKIPNPFIKSGYIGG